MVQFLENNNESQQAPLRSDNDLINSYFNGEQKSLEVLIERHVQSVYNFTVYFIGGSEDTADIVQDVFVRAWKNLKRFDQGKSFKTWLFTIAKNASLDWIKKKKPLLFSQFENKEGENMFIDTLADESLLSADTLFEMRESGEMLERAMTKLSSHYKTVLFMRYYEGLSLQEISSILDKSIETVKSQHRRALQALRKITDESKEL